MPRKDSSDRNPNDKSRNKRTSKTTRKRPKYDPEKLSRPPASNKRGRKNNPRSRPQVNFEIERPNPNIRLNRYIANAGICSRRQADDLIQAGRIQVNGKVVKDMGTRVAPTDEVRYDGKILYKEKPIYILLNKPKNVITTTDDPQNRTTVMDLVKEAGQERMYPVGRLDRHTTGLLVLTNDGELAKKLTHPSHQVAKVYRVDLDKPITEDDFEQLQNGLTLEDGLIKPDEVAVVSADGQTLGVEIHSGKNRIVRRMFEHLGYEVVKLDRTVYGGLIKGNLRPGKWRFLKEKEVVHLKFFSGK